MFSKNWPLKNTLEASERHAIPLQHKTGLRLATLSGGHAFVNYIYLLMQNMCFITQKEMTQQLITKPQKHMYRKWTGMRIHMCNECVLPLTASHAFLFWKAMPVRGQFTCIVYLSLLFCFSFLLPSCKSLVKVLLWQVKINRSRHYWQPCGTEEKRSERGHRRLRHSIPIQ